MRASRIRGLFWIGALAGAVGALTVAGPPALAQSAAQDFQGSCVSCHTIGGGRLVGPDLKDVTTRRDRAWLRTFIQNPAAVIAGGDAYATKLQQEARGVVMPTLPGLTPSRIDGLLDLIEAESKLPQSRFKGIQLSDRPFVPADTEQGRAIFLGGRALAGGGPQCMSCHHLESVAGLGGGALGPDLTKVFERLGGRKGLGAWLSAPATPTMQVVFGQRPLDAGEIEALTAFFQDAAQKPDPPIAREAFGLLGLAGALGMLGMLGFFWRGRLRGVRAPLVQAAALKGDA